MKNLLAVLVVLLVIGGGAYALVSHKDAQMPAQTTNVSNNKKAAATTPTPAKTVTTNVTLQIQNMAFAPSGSVTIKKGTTVTWVNKDATVHTVQETDGKTGPASGNLKQGDTYKFTYDTVGTFAYHCSFHPSMTGTITVTE